MTQPAIRPLDKLDADTLRTALVNLSERPLTTHMARRLTSLDPLLLIGVSAAAAGDEENVDAVVTRYLAANRKEG